MDGLTNSPSPSAYSHRQDSSPANSPDTPGFKIESSQSVTVQFSSKHLSDSSHTAIHHRVCKPIDSMENPETGYDSAIWSDAESWSDADTFEVCPMTKVLKDRLERIRKPDEQTPCASIHRQLSDYPFLPFFLPSSRPSSLPSEIESHIAGRFESIEVLFDEICHIVDSPEESSDEIFHPSWMEEPLSDEEYLQVDVFARK